MSTTPISVEAKQSVQRILKAIRELRQNNLPHTALVLKERVLRAFPESQLHVNSLNGHIVLWWLDGPVADSEWT